MIFSRPVAKVVIKASSNSPVSLAPPAGAKRALVKLWGGGGGAGGNSNSTFGGNGGGGGFVEAEFKITGGYSILVGKGGEGGPSIKPGSGVNSGKGGGGGASTILLDSTGKNPLLVAAGGGGGGGAMATDGGNGGAAGFTSGANGSVGCGGSNCPTAGRGATAGTGATSVGASGTPQNPMCSLLPPLTISTKSSSAGVTQSDSNPAATGGSAGTCYAGSFESVGPGGLAYYDSTNAVGCSSGAGGDGRAGGGGGGVAINTSVGCAGGGGGAGFLKTAPLSPFKARWEDGSGEIAGAASDADASLGDAAQAGQGGLTAAANKAAGNPGADGLAVIYYY